jgi:hypothetical protein
MKNNERKCTICESHLTEEDQTMRGEIGIIPVEFCIWCLTGLLDMAEQLNPCPCRDDEE